MIFALPERGWPGSYLRDRGQKFNFKKVSHVLGRTKDILRGKLSFHWLEAHISHVCTSQTLDA